MTSSWAGGVGRTSGERKKEEEKLGLRETLGDPERKQEIQNGREVMPCDGM